MKTTNSPLRKTEPKDEGRFKAALELSLEGFVVLQAVRRRKKIVDFVWDYVNPAASRLLRVGAKELVGQSFLQTFPPAKKAGLFASYVRVVETGEPQEGEVAYRTAKISGWWHQAAARLGDGVVVSLREITEKKLWEESLKQSEARFRVITQSNMVGLFFWDENGFVLDANETFLQTLGFRREEFFRQKMNLQDLTPKEFWELDRQALAEMKKRGACQPFEKELHHQNGSRIPVLFGLARLEAINYEGVGFVVDISERKEMEKQREILLGHELKTPLAGIKGYAQLLKGRLQKNADEKTLGYLERIAGKVDDLTQLISDLADLSRLRAGKLEFRDEVFVFDDLVKEVVDDCQSMAQNCRFLIEGKTGKQLLADKARIVQVLTNLLTNAVKYSPEAKEVKVRLSGGEKGLQVAVRDFGLGIPVEDQEKIFQPFFRSALSKNMVPGIGLGLYISLQIIRHYSGEIALESQVGKGSTFTVSLPREISLTLGSYSRSRG